MYLVSGCGCSFLWRNGMPKPKRAKKNKTVIKSSWRSKGHGVNGLKTSKGDGGKKMNYNA